MLSTMVLSTKNPATLVVGGSVSNNNKISYKLDTDKVLEEHINTLFAYVIKKIN